MFTLRINNIDNLGDIFLAQMKELIYRQYTVIHYEDEGFSLTQYGMGHCTKAWSLWLTVWNDETELTANRRHSIRLFHLCHLI